MPGLFDLNNDIARLHFAFAAQPDEQQRARYLLGSHHLVIPDRIAFGDDAPIIDTASYTVGIVIAKKESMKGMKPGPHDLILSKPSLHVSLKLPLLDAFNYQNFKPGNLVLTTMGQDKSILSYKELRIIYDIAPEERTVRTAPFAEGGSTANIFLHDINDVTDVVKFVIPSTDTLYKKEIEPQLNALGFIPA
ncbi:MAG: hypothetical protein KDJ75_02960 [Alphaproteobacteria bacterium]|nr:hypothetical protein [Alphaproteobacteria bacterium]